MATDYPVRVFHTEVCPRVGDRGEQTFGWLAPDDLKDGERLPFLLLLHGHDGNYRGWYDETRLARYAARYRMVIVCPDGENGWYTNFAGGGRPYEDDIMEALLPWVRANLPVQTSVRSWAVGGLSMGGYGAVKLALKYYEVFGTAISHSGAPEAATWRGEEYDAVFGAAGPDNVTRKLESPFWLAEQALSRFPEKRPFLFLDCGDKDDLLDSNRRFRDHLNFIGYPQVQYTEAPGYHTWPYWDRMLKTLLPDVAARIGAAREAGVEDRD